jgi:hypothetical protein
MGMSMHIVGFRPPDERWKKMKQVWDACAQAGVSPPSEVEKFFGGERPDENGVEVRLLPGPAVREFKQDMQEGFEVDVSKLPADLKIIRFFCSW